MLEVVPLLFIALSVPAEPVAETPISTQQACGRDRRCRIERLKRQNASRRQLERLQEEAELERAIAEEEQRKRAAIPRLEDPWFVGYRASRLGAVGVTVGRYFFGHLGVETSAFFESHNIEHHRSEFYGDLETYFWRTGAKYSFLDGYVSPYVSMAFILGLGDIWAAPIGYEWAYDQTIEEPTDDGSLAAHFHLLEIGAGVNVQTTWGLFVDLGVVYRADLYIQARIGRAQYDETAYKALRRHYHQNLAFDVVGNVGWAF